MIVYASRTGNVRYIASKLKAECIEISEELKLTRPYLLITYTDGLGDIPAKVAHAAMYHISLVRKLDLRGYQEDYEAIQKFYETRVTG